MIWLTFLISTLARGGSLPAPCPHLYAQMISPGSASPTGPAFPRELLTLAQRLQKERRLAIDQLALLESDPASIRSRPAIAGEIGRLKGQVSALTARLMPLREVVGVAAADTAAAQTALGAQTVMILRHTEAAALGKLVHHGIGKQMFAKFHSAGPGSGVIAGLVPYDQSLAKAGGAETIAKLQALVDQALAEGKVSKEPFRVGGLVAIKRNGTTVFVDPALVHVREEDIAFVLTAKENGEARVIVSDVDALAFGFREGTPSPATAQGTLGTLSNREKEALETYNQRLSGLLEKDSSVNRYMTHGPESRNPQSHGVSGYPLTAYFPGEETRTIPRGPDSDPDRYLKEFYAEAKRKGFALPVNPLWGWPDGLGQR